MTSTRWVQWAAASAFWGFITLLYAVQMWLIAPSIRQAGEQFLLSRTLVWQGGYYLGWIPFTVWVWRLTANWDPASLGWPRFLARHVAGLLVVSILHGIMVITAATLILGPTAEPAGQMLVGQLRGRIYQQMIVYAGIVALGQATAMYARWRDRDAQAAALEAQLTAARLDALRAQLQPHFLFNSLHAIASLVRDGRNADAVRLISGLSDLLRRVLDHEQRESTLGEELELVRRYVEIQQVRFGDRLRVTMTVEPGLDDARLPALSLQPLVENAVRHGLAPKTDAGRIDLRVRRRDGQLIIEVEDDGVGLPAGWTREHSAGTGLRNLAARLDAQYGARGTLAVRAAAPSGALVRLTLPVVPAS